MAIRKLARWKLFSAFLGLGTLCGLLLGSLMGAPASAKVLAEADQSNLLVVLVEDAEAESSPLLGAWLLASSNLNNEIDWVPLYPTPLEFGGDYTAAHEPIAIAPADLDALEGLKPLRAAGVWWDQAVVLDRSALDALLDAPPNFDAIQSWIEPQRALHQQVSAIQDLCAQPDLLRSQSALDAAIDLLGGHAHSTITPFDLIARWDRQQAAPAPACSHPWAED